MLVWQPQITQTALSWLVRGIHLRMSATGASPDLDDSRRDRTDAQRAARLLLMAIATSSKAVASRIGTSRTTEWQRASLLAGPRVDADSSGIRVLHLGRHFSQGVDIYPLILTAWKDGSSA